MTKRLLFLILALLLIAAPAFAINEGHYPKTVFDTNCTDTNDTPAAPGEVGARPGVQTSGSGDGFCDHDSRIVSAAVTADITFGPFALPNGATGIIVWVDADVVSNDTDTWDIDILIQKPHDLAFVALDSSGSQSTEGAKSFGFSPALLSADNGATTQIDVSMHPVFFIRLDLGTATSWDGSISWRSF